MGIGAFAPRPVRRLNRVQGSDAWSSPSVWCLRGAIALDASLLSLLNASPDARTYDLLTVIELPVTRSGSWVEPG
jgi:hypothetical protein